MDEQQQKILKETFDTVSTGYDSPALRFFVLSAEQMASMPEFGGDEHVLDVACGTGHASLAFARRLPRGRVTAADFSTGMLQQARRKAAAAGIRNIEFVEQDMTALGFPDGMFDVAVCAFGIFFVPDMETQLAHIASKVRPGGRVMICNFEENYFEPLKRLFIERVRSCGIEEPPPGWRRIAHEVGCRELFEKAGLTSVSVEKRNVGYYLESAEQWWDIVWNAGYRRLLSRMSPDGLVRFRQGHLAEIDALRSDKGIWLDVGVLYTTGIKR